MRVARLMGARPNRPRHFAGDASHCPKAVVYVSDEYDGVVNIYPRAGKNQTMCGQISGFSEPENLAVDVKGNLYVADVPERVFKFAPGKTKPMLTIDDRGEDPWGVSVNAKGVIAVANIETIKGDPGNISLFNPDGSSIGNFQDNSNFAVEWYCKIDANGDVYTLGTPVNDSAGYVNVFRAPAYKPTDLNITYGLPGGIEIVNDVLYVCDAEAKTITAYKNAMGPGTTFALAQAAFPAQIAFLSHTAKLPFYEADFSASQAQEYLVGDTNEVNAINTNAYSTPAGVAVSRDF
jgi:hypothetical protein